DGGRGARRARTDAGNARRRRRARDGARGRGRGGNRGRAARRARAPARRAAGRRGRAARDDRRNRVTPSRGGYRRAIRTFLEIWLEAFRKHRLLTYATAVAMRGLTGFVSLTFLAIRLLAAPGETER